MELGRYIGPKPYKATGQTITLRMLCLLNFDFYREAGFNTILLVSFLVFEYEFYLKP